MMKSVLDIAAEMLAAGFTVVGAQEQDARYDLDAELTINRRDRPFAQDIVIQVAYEGEAVEFGVSQAISSRSRKAERPKVRHFGYFASLDRVVLAIAKAAT